MAVHIDKINDQLSLNNIDSLLFQLALQTRELSQKKNELYLQVKVCRADIAERKACIESIQRNIKKLEEDISLKQSTVMHNKANAKSMKVTNNLLLQYEQTLKAELESKKASYNHDIEVFEERIVSYRNIFQSHKEYYYQNPLTQKLLTLQAEKEEIECRIKACDDQITITQKELNHLTGPVPKSASIQELPDGVSGQETITEPEKQLDHQIEFDDCSSDISSLHLNQTKEGPIVSVEVNADENSVQDTITQSHYPEEANTDLWSYEQLNVQSQNDEIPISAQGKENDVQDQVMEHQTTTSEKEDAVEDDVEERVSQCKVQTPSKENNEGLTIFSQSSSQEMTQSSLEKVTAVSSTPTFPFSFSPSSSPHQGTVDRQSPAFLFSLNSDPSTPGFTGFGFDVGSSHDEDSSFTFSGSFFNEKKTTQSKSSTCPEFLFDQSEQSDDFQFAFASKSPQEANKDNTRNEFPFSFNF